MASEEVSAVTSKERARWACSRVMSALKQVDTLESGSDERGEHRASKQIPESNIELVFSLQMLLPHATYNSYSYFAVSFICNSSIHSSLRYHYI